MVFCGILDWHQLTWWNPAMLRETRRGRCHRGIRSSLSPLGGLIFLAASLRVPTSAILATSPVFLRFLNHCRYLVSILAFPATAKECNVHNILPAGCPKLWLSPACWRLLWKPQTRDLLLWLPAALVSETGPGSLEN